MALELPFISSRSFDHTFTPTPFMCTLSTTRLSCKTVIMYGVVFDRLIDTYPRVCVDGMEMVNPKRYRIHPNVTEVGCERHNQPQSNAQCLQLNGPNIQPRHCVIAHTEGIVTVTPCSRDAETYVNGQRIFETTILQVSRHTSYLL